MLMHHFSDRKKNSWQREWLCLARFTSNSTACTWQTSCWSSLHSQNAQPLAATLLLAILKNVTHFCKSCDTCQREGKGRKLPPAPLISVPLMSAPWLRIAIDIVGPLSVCPKTWNRFLLTCINLATHYLKAILIEQHTAEEVANALAQVFSHFGFPEEILCDKGTEFICELMQLFLFQFSITQVRSSPYHPETNGSCERFHRTLKSMLRSMVDGFNDSWTGCLPWTLFTYREIPIESLGFSPFELLNAYNVRGPLSLVRSTWSRNPASTTSNKRSVLQHIINMHERIAKCTELAIKVAENTKNTLKNLVHTAMHGLGGLTRVTLS